MPRARPVTIDFSRADKLLMHSSGNIVDRGDAADLRPRDADGKLLTPKQIRARARRRADTSKRRLSGGRNGKAILTPQEMAAMYKPLDEWDMDELARGRPRNRNGNFSGASPSWITREVHEQAMERFKNVVKTELNSQGVTALKTLEWVLTNEEVDDRGKPIVPASTKLQAAQMLVEHIVGKPKQIQQTDISVKLQGILASVMVNPNDALAPPSQGGMLPVADDTPAYSLAHLPGQTIPMGVPGTQEPMDVDSWEDEDDDLDPE